MFRGCLFLLSIFVISCALEAYRGRPHARTDNPEQIPAAKTSELRGKVIHVADGDTVTILTASKQQQRIRLDGIDAPESGQEFGNLSKKALSSLIHGKEVVVRTMGQDIYGRTLGWITVDGADINRRMVADGWAWHYAKYNKEQDLAELQNEARRGRRGLWKAPNEPMPPWEFRSLGRRTSGERTAPAPSPTPGKPAESGYWINDNGIRHNSSCRWFGKTSQGHRGGKNEGKPCDICGG